MPVVSCVKLETGARMTIGKCRAKASIVNPDIQNLGGQSSVVFITFRDDKLAQNHYYSDHLDLRPVKNWRVI